MEAALRAAGLSPSEIGYVNAHGTGTLANDAAEARAIAELFGRLTPVSSTKGLHGHLLGSAGALEAAISVLALSERMAWAGAGLDDGPTEPGIHIARAPEELRARHVLSNSFGFGGNNVSLVFSSVDEVDRGI
jgi:3-oxoacyl-(acyl-carrier-protein) synthase